MYQEAPTRITYRVARGNYLSVAFVSTEELDGTLRGVSKYDDQLKLHLYWDSDHNEWREVDAAYR